MAIITTFPSARRKKLKRKEREGEEKKRRKSGKWFVRFPWSSCRMWRVLKSRNFPPQHWLAACRKKLSTGEDLAPPFSFLSPASTNTPLLPRPRLPFYRVWFASTLHELRYCHRTTALTTSLVALSTVLPWAPGATYACHPHIHASVELFQPFSGKSFFYYAPYFY